MRLKTIITTSTVIFITHILYAQTDSMFLSFDSTTDRPCAIELSIDFGSGFLGDFRYNIKPVDSIDINYHGVPLYFNSFLGFKYKNIKGGITGAFLSRGGGARYIERHEGFTIGSCQMQVGLPCFNTNVLVAPIIGYRWYDEGTDIYKRIDGKTVLQWSNEKKYRGALIGSEITYINKYSNYNIRCSALQCLSLPEVLQTNVMFTKKTWKIKKRVPFWVNITMLISEKRVRTVILSIHPVFEKIL